MSIMKNKSVELKIPSARIRAEFSMKNIDRVTPGPGYDIQHD